MKSKIKLEFKISRLRCLKMTVILTGTSICHEWVKKTNESRDDH